MAKKQKANKAASNVSDTTKATDCGSNQASNCGSNQASKNCGSC